MIKTLNTNSQCCVYQHTDFSQNWAVVPVIIHLDQQKISNQLADEEKFIIRCYPQN